MKKQKTVLIIGGGPAGLTAAYEVLTRSKDHHVVVLEADAILGGIARTVNYKGNRIDIGGHRFFSKSERVMNWWESMMPLQGAKAWDDRVLGRDVPLSRLPGAPDPEEEDTVLLYRRRLSRIFFLRKFFDYPVSLNTKTVTQLGPRRIYRILRTYLHARKNQITPEKSLEDFLINRFGQELYETFFRDYTHKVWGVPCSEIKPEWGAQRIKGLSITKAVLHALKSTFRRDTSLTQKGTQTSLIGQFLYPKLGPGQMWDVVAEKVKDMGGEIHLHHKVQELVYEDGAIKSLRVEDTKTGKTHTMKGDFVLSTMPIQHLIAGMGASVPPKVQTVAKGLRYRDFITVGILASSLIPQNQTKHESIGNIIPDNWIYIQEKDVLLGRLQIFNNWSPYMVKDVTNSVWLGLEYFCNEGDDLWIRSDKDLMNLGIGELSDIGLLDPACVKDSCVIRMPKAYPAYFGTYDDLPIVKDFLNGVENLYVLGRNGMHKYNNQDHSMLTAMRVVDHMLQGGFDRKEIWDINAEEEYHEEKK